MTEMTGIRLLVSCVVLAVLIFSVISGIKSFLIVRHTRKVQKEIKEIRLAHSGRLEKLARMNNE
jgi:preprotein translocase subunit YajC